MEIPIGYAQANFHFAVVNSDQTAQVTLGVAVSGYAGDPADAAQALWQNWDESILVWQSSALQLERVSVKYGPGNTGAAGEYASTTAGEQGTGMLPLNSALLVRKNTIAGGRSGRGRMYVPGIVESTVGVDGRMDPENLSFFQTAVDSFLAKCQADELNPVLLHGEQSPVSSPYLITSLTATPLVGTQRRRLRR